MVAAIFYTMIVLFIAYNVWDYLRKYIGYK